MAGANEKGPRVDEDWKRQVDAQRALEAEQGDRGADNEGADEGLFLAGFEGVVQMVAMQALMAMGAFHEAQNDDEPIPVDMPSARLLIDMLDVLKEKTQGNLTEQESVLLTQNLTQLRMLFVQLQGEVGEVEPKPKSRIVLP